MVVLGLFGLGFLAYGVYSLWFYTKGYGAKRRNYRGWAPKFDLPEYIKPKLVNSQQRQSLLMTSLLSLFLGGNFLLITYVLLKR